MDNNIMKPENKKVEIFSNDNFGNIRGIEINGEPWLVGKDVAATLGYADPRSTVSKKVDKEDRGVAKMETPSGIQEMTIINESGFYSLVLGSKLPEAKKFKRWVTSEVLPQIRQTGGYNSKGLSELIKKQQEQINNLHSMVLNLINDAERIEKCVGIRSKQVFNYSRYIKNRLGIRKVDANYEVIKQRILFENNCQRWEELTYQDEIIDRIDELVDKYKNYEQLMFKGVI